MKAGPPESPWHAVFPTKPTQRFEVPTFSIFVVTFLKVPAVAELPIGFAGL